jgi:uncharacterized membrane protein
MIVLLLITVLVCFATAIIVFASSDDKINTNHLLSETKAELVATRNTFLVLLSVSLLTWTAFFIAGKFEVEAHLNEWLNLVVRWAHVLFGIAWIGASFYFIFLENSLNRTDNLRDDLAGNLWAIHGGGFYYVEKYKFAPEKLPQKLHWFKYEAYFTWITGFLLLTIVYYMNAKAFMIDPQVRDISESTAVLTGLSSLVGGWLIYDLLCKTSLLRKPKLFVLIGFIIISVFAYILSHILSGRAAFMHIGALLGTIMAANVFFVIIPSQKALVYAAKNNLPLNPDLGKKAGLRSLHNNYITLPVVFVMISNHFPSTFGTAYNWIILAVLTLSSVAIRHFINLHEKGINQYRLIAYGAVGIIALIIVTAPVKKDLANTPKVHFAEVQSIFNKRCITCHSSKPTDDIQTVAPNGIMFDQPEEIVRMKDRIMVRAVQTKTMPQGNKTGITEEEREIIGRWIAQGSNTKD